ncbi:MAG: dihydrolipoamide acetyltransferase family protein [Bacteroidia bacterium]|nr:dihydrolipoamide acetyltransferase family protein [Bacteroidia bacterium]
MATFELTMPKMGESIIEATILRWTKEIGDPIQQEESVLEIATDKVDSEVPSPVSGVLLDKRYKEGDVVPVGAVVAVIETEAGAVASAPAAQPPASEPAAELAAEVPYVPAAGPELSANSGSGRFYSPLVLNIARTEGISMQQLEAIAGTGREGRVTKKDILAFVAQRSAAPQTPAAPLPLPAAPLPPAVPAPKAPAVSGSVEIIEMDRMRKLIAQNMVRSRQTSAHVTSFVEADVTHLVLWRSRHKDLFQQRYGEKLTLTPVFAQIVARVLREFPMINSSVDGDRILVKQDINLGIAVALPTDNLIVPVIRHADRLNLAGLSSAINDLAARARANKLRPDELDGGTYTLTNVGSFGSIMGTPIILQPQVGILATGAVRKTPAVIETPTGDVIAIRHRMFLSHSYDHRIIDGSLGSRFAQRVADLLEAWDLNTPV